MAKIDVIDIDRNKVGEVDLNDSIFAAKIKPHLVHEVVRMHLANKRSGTAKTKERAEKRGGGAKPFRQKGTGRARAGSTRSPLWRGGGTTFGPKPRSFAIKVSKKIRRQALRSALTAKLKEARLIILDSFTMDQVRTKDFIDAMERLEVANGLIITPEKDETLKLSSRNVPNVKILRHEGLNVYDILKFQHLILLKDALPKIEERLT